jgi:phosphoglycolate phosphatase-like HAD superfamily hydrolase
VLFDLDGTLIDSVYEHVRAWHQALADALPPCPEAGQTWCIFVYMVLPGDITPPTPVTFSISSRHN